MACSFVGLPIVAIFMIIPESPRWLFANGRSEDGLKVLKRLSRSSNDLQVEISVSPAANEGHCGQMIEMIRSKPLMVAIQVFSWL